MGGCLPPAVEIPWDFTDSPRGYLRPEEAAKVGVNRYRYCKILNLLDFIRKEGLDLFVWGYITAQSHEGAAVSIARHVNQGISLQ
ncbi:hypothetical protein SAMN05443432_105236 [Roseovarius litoreus]|uniref:Uncharacterized protein n=1 Tax=Roseovarius litoreus TaxID=1155722 RepID=A0A1M7H3I9_9RHOB|nr:hypothetical protein SAMN05443432_105236 [Roseovarius litoreus]